MKIARFEPWHHVDLLNRYSESASKRAVTSQWVPPVDIVEEVHSRLRSVRSQAGKARKYREYSDRLQQAYSKSSNATRGH